MEGKNGEGLQLSVKFGLVVVHIASVRDQEMEWRNEWSREWDKEKQRGRQEATERADESKRVQVQKASWNNQDHGTYQPGLSGKLV